MSGKKNYDLRIRISTEELEKIKCKAEKCGMTISGYARYVLVNSNVKVSLVE